MYSKANRRSNFSCFFSNIKPMQKMEVGKEYRFSISRGSKLEDMH